MKYWLVKSEPFKYSWTMMLKDKVTYWDGVRNYQARNNLKLMKVDGVSFDIIKNEWFISKDEAVNYIAKFKKI